MLSTINWTNKGLASDGFDAVFGASATTARADAVAAFATWQRVIQDFHNGTNSIDIALSIGGVGLGGSGGVTNSTIVDGRPTSGTINLAGGTDGLGGGYYLDPTPYDSSEFNGNITNAFAGIAKPGTPAAGALDFYTLVLLETTHVLGTSKNPSLRIWTSGLLTNTNIPIPAGREEAGPGAGNLNNTYWLFNGGLGTKVLFNGSANTGNPADLYNAVHSASTTVPPVVYNGVNYYGAEDAANGFWTNGERYIPSSRIARLFQDAYGYTINDPSLFGTFYDRLDANGTLTITTPAGNSNDTLDLQISGGNLLVTLGLGTPVLGGDPSSILSVLPITSVNNISINMGGGSDTVTIHSLYNSIPISLNMGFGVGYDVLNVWGGAGYDSITVDSPSLIGTGITLTSFTGVSALNLYTNGGDADIYFTDAGSALSATINGSGGAEFINLHSLTPYTPLSIFANAGNDTISIAPLGGNDVFMPQVAVYGGDGNDTLTLASSASDEDYALISFDGGPYVSGVGDRLIFDDASRSYDTSYDISSTSIKRDGLGPSRTFNYTAVQGIVVNAGSGSDTFTVRSGVVATLTLNGNNGNDNFIVGDGNLTGFQPQGFNGGGGTDTITFNDQFDSTSRIWDIRPDEVLFGGLIPLTTVSFESVAILGGINGDEYTFAGNFFQTLYVDGNLGSDTFTVGFQNNKAAFFAPVTLLGGVGNEVFTWQYGSYNWYFGLSGTSTYPVMLDGGTGLNTLSINETTRTTAASYQLYADRFFANDAMAFPSGADFAFDNMGAIGITLNNSANAVAVYGISSDIQAGQQVTLLLQGGSDAVSLYPRDANGELTINGNFGIGGGSGTDTVTIQDTASTLPIVYTFLNLFGAGTTNISGLGTGGFGTGSDLESIVINAGAGDDTFNVSSFQSGSALAINGGFGNDTLNFGTTTVASVTNLASFNFNGQGDSDTFNFNNSSNTAAWTYNRNLNGITASSSLGANYALGESNVELMQIFSGSQADSFYMNTVATGTEINLFGGAGIDGLALGFAASSAENIHGRVRFFGEGLGGHVAVYDQLDITADIVHLSKTELGAAPGDTLFGVGGALEFHNVANATFDGVGMRMFLGSGTDTLFAVPLATAKVSVNGGNPTTLPGDRLHLTWENVTNPVFTSNGTGAGIYTFGVAQPFAYTGFESIVGVYPGDFDQNGFVGPEDLAVWKAEFGANVVPGNGADGNGNGIVNGADFLQWQRGFGLGVPSLAAATSESSAAPNGADLIARTAVFDEFETSSVARPVPALAEAANSIDRDLTSVAALSAQFDRIAKESIHPKMRALQQADFLSDDGYRPAVLLNELTRTESLDLPLITRRTVVSLVARDAAFTNLDNQGELAFQLQHWSSSTARALHSS